MEMLELKISNPNKQISKPAEIKTRKFTSEEKERLAKAAIDFESLLTQMVLKSMTQTTEGGLLGKGEGLGSDVFSSIFEGELAEYMSKNQSMGVASMLYEKMTGEKLDLNRLKAEELKRKIYAPENYGGNEIDKIVPHGSALARLKKYEPLVQNIAKKYGVSDALVKSIIVAESSARHDAVSTANAKGLMQLMDGTARELGVNNPFDPVQNIEGGTKYIAKLLEDFGGEIDTALAAYNAGPENVKKYGGVPPFEETQNYVKRVKAYLKYFKGE
jgi:Rod binding domain-containing protein